VSRGLQDIRAPAARLGLEIFVWALGMCVRGGTSSRHLRASTPKAGKCAMQINYPWPTVELGEVCDEVTVGFVGSMASEYVDIGVPFIRSLNVKPFRVDKANIKYISPDFHAKIQKSRLRIGDVVIVRTGVPGTTAVVPDWLDGGNCSDLVIARPSSRLDAAFLCYFMNAVAHHVGRMYAVGAVQQHFNVGAAKTLQIPLPPLPTQRAIAGVLGALDDKIEQNRRTARALERLARAIFRAWFVDFEPVKAKAAGATSFPSMPQAVFDALPTTFTDSDLGPVPHGWAARPFSSQFKIVSGGTPKRAEPAFWGGDIPWYSVKDAPADGCIWVDTTEETISQEGLENSAAAVVPKGCTIISARGTVGKLGLTGRPMTFNQSCYGLLPAEDATWSYLYFVTQHAVNELQQRTHGSVFDTITRATFETTSVVCSPLGLQQAFDYTVGPLLESMLALTRESAKLASLRDYLLPRLLSGQVPLEVSNA
jgi:type I restriction enzyme, S subunit